jgi:hypothetical protein
MSQRPRAERRLVAVYLLLASLTLAHAVYLTYGVYFAEVTGPHPGLTQQAYYALHNTTAMSADHPLFHASDHAPNQYRVGVPWLAKAIARPLGIAKLYVVYTVFDFACALAAGWLCYLGLLRSAFFAALPEDRRPLAVVALLAAFAWPLAWVVPWQRPETLPSALYLLATLAMLDRLRPRPGYPPRTLWIAAIAAATLCQSSVRTDIPTVLGAAVLLLPLLSGPASRQLFGSRKLCLATGALIAGIAVSAQLCLQKIVFPHALYPPDTPVLELAANLAPRRLIAFTIAMLPWAIVVALALRLRPRLEPLDWLPILAGSLYLPLWWTVGVVGEVRLFVPFLLAMVVVAAKILVLLTEPPPSSAITLTDSPSS